MNKINQLLLTATLVSALLVIYLFVGSWILNARADYECMKYDIPHAQVVALKTYCGGILNGSDVSVPLSVVKEKYGEK